MKRLALLTALVLALHSNAHGQTPSGTYIDLSHSYHAEIPAYPGTPPYVLENLATIDQGYYINKFTMAEHYGTHVDAPSHFAEGGKHMSEIGINDLVGPLVLLDVTEKAAATPDLEISKQDILDWETAHGEIPAGAFVIANSSWWKKWEDPKAYLNIDEEEKLRFPGFSTEAVQFLLQERNIKGVGTDTLSTDHGSSHTFDEHHLLLGAGKINIENLTNLDQLPPSGATLFVAPIKIEQGSGAPARIFAFIPEK